MNNVRNLALLGLVCLAGCGLGTPSTSEAESAVSNPIVTTDASSYSPGQSITVTYSGLPGTSTDWVAIAPSGSDDTVTSAWVYTGGQTSGAHIFSGVATTGSYVARTFSEDSYTLVAESNVFTIANSGATLTTTSATYATGQAIVANWTGLPGTSTDWIAIAPPGSDPTTTLAWAYTGGAANGTHTFSGIATVGDYVVRVFPSDSYAVASEAAFSVVVAAAATVTTDSSAYGVGSQVVVSWSGLPGNSTDWIALAPEGSSVTTVTRWAYTGGQASGSMSFESPSTGGLFVARAFVNDSYSQLGESAAFSVGVDLTTDKSSYSTSDHVVVSWDNLPGNQFDWIALAPAGSPVTTVTNWVYTQGAVSGSNSFGALANGTYVARAFLNNTYTEISESASFVVGSANITVSTDASTYAVGGDVTVTWTNLPGNQHDWIAVAPDGSPDTTTTRWVYTNGAASGSTTFSGGLSSAGSYVARAFENDTYAKLGESSAFAVQ